MKEYIIKFKDISVELSERPEIYLFMDESCTESEWIPFDGEKLKQHQNWVIRKILQGHEYNLTNHEKIRFKLKNPEDINIFIDWMSEYAEVIFKKTYAKDIEYYESTNKFLDENITFLNSILASINDDYIDISADYMVNSPIDEKDKIKF